MHGKALRASEGLFYLLRNQAVARVEAGFREANSLASLRLDALSSATKLPGAVWDRFSGSRSDETQEGRAMAGQEVLLSPYFRTSEWDEHKNVGNVFGPPQAGPAGTNPRMG